MTRFQAVLLHTLAAVVALTFASSQLLAQVNVLTWHNDIARTGQNTNETALVPSVVNKDSFGKLCSHRRRGLCSATAG